MASYHRCWEAPRLVLALGPAPARSGPVCMCYMLCVYLLIASFLFTPISLFFHVGWIASRMQFCRNFPILHLKSGLEISFRSSSQTHAIRNVSGQPASFFSTCIDSANISVEMSTTSTTLFSCTFTFLSFSFPMHIPFFSAYKYTSFSWSFSNPIWHSTTLCLQWSAIMPLYFHLLQCSLMVGLPSLRWLFVLLLLISWVTWNNKPLPFRIKRNIKILLKLIVSSHWV